MLMCKYQDPTRKVLKYPLSYEQMRNEFKNVSFPPEGVLTEENLLAVPVARVYPSEKPVFNEITQELVEDTPVWDGTRFNQVWAVNDLPPAKVAVNTKMRQRTFNLAVQRFMDKVCRDKGYDSLLSACSYAVSSNPTFAAEGSACVDWRDAVWAKCFQIQEQVEAGQRPVPTVNDVLAEIPKIVWPVVG